MEAKTITKVLQNCFAMLYQKEMGNNPLLLGHMPMFNRWSFKIIYNRYVHVYIMSVNILYLYMRI